MAELPDFVLSEQKLTKIGHSGLEVDRCPACKRIDVTTDATVEWDIAEQSWVVRDLGMSVCGVCGDSFDAERVLVEDAMRAYIPLFAGAAPEDLRELGNEYQDMRNAICLA